MYDSLARYYDFIHSLLTADREYVLKLAERTGGPVLELGCGTGRLLIPLAQAGYTVTGVDNSSAMLARAHNHLDRELLSVRQRVDLVEGDVKSLSLCKEDKYFSLILLPYNTLLHFQTDEILRIFRSAFQYLHHDGQLFIDVTNPFLIDQVAYDPEPTLENNFFDEEAGESIRQWSQSQLDSTGQCLHTSWIFEDRIGIEPISNRTVIEFDYWYYYPHQLELLLQQSGYQLLQMLGDYDGSAFAEESDRLLIIARRSPD